MGRLCKAIMATNPAHTHYRDSLRVELSEFDNKIEKLALQMKQIEPSDEETMLAYERYLDALQIKREAIEMKLDQMETVEENLWDGIQAGMEEIWDDFKLTFSRASEEFEAGQKIRAERQDLNPQDTGS